MASSMASRSCVKVFRRDADRLRLEDRCDKPVDNECVARHDNVRPLFEEHVAHELDQLVAAVAYKHFVHMHAESLREPLPEVEAGAVRVQVHFLRRLDHRVDRLRRRAKRVFVGCDLDDFIDIAKAEFARDFLDRPTRLVRGQPVYPWIRQVFHNSRLRVT